MDSNQILTVAEEVARRIGERMREVCLGQLCVDVFEKAKDDLVTEVDIWAEKEVEKAIRANFPEHNIIGEESWKELQKRTGKTLREISAEGICWIVDPIDGTANFVQHIPHSVISIGILKDGIRRIGLVYDPYRDELFTAVKGEGAMLNGKKISVSKTADLSVATVGTSFPADNNTRWDTYRVLHETLIRSFRRVRIFGAAALEQCWVACGRLDAFVEYSLQPWDMAAGTLIVEEAGGRVGCFVSDVHDEGFSVFTPSLLVANAEIFEPLQALSQAADEVAPAT